MISSQTKKVNEGANIKIDTSSVKNTDIGGVGFECDGHFWTQLNKDAGINETNFQSVIQKRWNECDPGIARVYHDISWYETVEGNKTWNNDEMLALYKDLQMLKDNGTIIYLATWYTNNPSWLGGGYEITDDATMRKFAGTVADCLEYLIHVKGFTNIRYYCIANELSTKNGFASFNLEHFKEQNQKIRDELNARGEPDLITLLAPDAACDSKPTQWCANNMDHLTGMYGNHLYGDHPDYSEYLSITNSIGKNLLVGEFGGEVCTTYTNTTVINRDPGYGIICAKHVTDFINHGGWGICNWTFFDFIYPGNKMMQWGTFADVKSGFDIRPHYYAMGLLTKFIRPGSTSYGTSSSILGVTACTVKRNNGGEYTIIVLNTGSTAQNVNVLISDVSVNTTFRKYVYDTANIPLHDDGNLQANRGSISVCNSAFTDTVPADSFIVYTNLPVYTGRDTERGKY